MIGLPLAFLSPWLLLALALLPGLWWLLRLMPPRPRRVDFPPLGLLLQTAPTEETPATTPWWLMALRLALAALIIVALAGPLLNPSIATLGGSGPVVVLADNGWAAAPSWPREVRTAEAVLAAAESANRPAALVALAEPPTDITLGTAAAARALLGALKPEPFADDRTGHLGPLQRFFAAHPDADIHWLSSGLDQGDGRAFATALGRVGGHVAVATPNATARGLADAENDPAALTIRVLRAEGAAGEQGMVRAYDLRGRPLGDAAFRFAGGDKSTSARLDLPIELRNEVARLDIAGQRTAGAVQLLDERWKRRTVGIVSGTTSEAAEPLLSPSYYIARAMQPYAELRDAAGVAPSTAIGRFIDGGVSVIVAADVGNLTPAARENIGKWIEDGGVLVRFAGPRLAASTDDDLAPVRLRHGGRVLGGTLEWGTPQPLGAFPGDSPFAGLAVPADVRVQRQVLAEPGPDLAGHTWAVLADGTPLVTARRQGRGLLVLFHVTGDTTWSNLPLSGTFVDMLRRVVALAGRPPAKAATTTAAAPAGEAAAFTPAQARQVLAPSRTLDGFGAFQSPPPTAKPVSAGGLAVATADHPPGIYGPPDGFVAVNALTPDATLQPLDTAGLDLVRRSFAAAEPIALAPWLLVAAFVLLLVDTAVMLWLSGATRRLRRRRAGGTALLVLLAAGALAVGPARPSLAASAAEKFAMDAALTTRLAYVVTGERDIDDTSRAGLVGLSQQLAARTAFVPGDPVGVDPAHDELAFFPLLYWAVPADAPAPSSATLAKLDTYMKRGGTILFDTRDALYGAPGTTSPGSAALRRILAGLDVPELEPLPPDHVLTKAFYLLNDFPGRYDGGTFWVEASSDGDQATANRPVRSGDGVSPILITSNDLAGAWAVDSDGRPLFPTVPDTPRAREMAYRAGINIVIYTLTGNYKADQVHVPALLERLGNSAMDLGLSFAPLVSRDLLVALAILGALAITVLIVLRPRGAGLRGLAVVLVLLALANPSLTQEDRQRLPNVLALVVDTSASQSFDHRAERTAALRKAITAEAAGLPGTELRTIEAGGSDGTELFKGLAAGLADVPPERVAGAILLTDGVVDDVPKSVADLGFSAPVHALLTGRPGERDRRLVLTETPRFGIVGKPEAIGVRIDQTPNMADDPVTIVARRDGEEVARLAVPPGVKATISVPITHAGPNVVELVADTAAGELTAVNNHAALTIDGIREKLRVLLVSGEPHPGERIWRSLLKSDPNVDLVHFTILRPPEKQDGTPINELSLIAFPTRELFQTKLDQFDLIIFDRYAHQGLLPMLYFENIARYVRNGGAVLIAAGPDYNGPGGLSETPLGAVLPAEPTGAVTEEPFLPKISDIGRRHPVTRDLAGGDHDPPQWSHWFRVIDTRVHDGSTLMSGAGHPLLVLAHEDRGRVALFLSDQIWLWARGYEGGGPHVELLRRLVHWLMKEPALEEEALRLSAQGNTLTVERQTLADTVAPVTLTTPSGKTQSVTLAPAEPGLFRATVAAAETGLYRAGDGRFVALASVGPANPREFQQVASTAALLQPIAEATGGSVRRAVDSAGGVTVPRLVAVRAGERAGGDDWIGVREPEASVVRGLRILPLLAGLLGLVLLLTILGTTWTRESR